MRVLVTGHRGYIGTVLTPLLAAAGHEVEGLDSDIYERCTFAPGGEMPEVKTLLKDVRDVEPSDLLGFDAVLHLAALSNDPLGNFRPATTFDINYEGTMRLGAYPCRLKPGSRAAFSRHSSGMRESNLRGLCEVSFHSV